MKTFAFALSAILVAPFAVEAQRSGAAASPGAAVGAGIAPSVAPTPGTPGTAISRTPAAARAPRAQPMRPNGPGGLNHPPVLSAPPAVGSTFQRPAIGRVPGIDRTIDPSASVPSMTVPPTQAPAGIVRVPQTVVDPNQRVVDPNQRMVAPGVAGTQFGRVPGQVVPNFRPITPRAFAPVRVPAERFARDEVVFDFPPGSTIIPDPNAINTPPVAVPSEPVVVPGPAERGTAAAPLAGEPAVGIGSGPGVEAGQSEVVRGAPAVPRQRSTGTIPPGVRVVRPNR